MVFVDFVEFDDVRVVECDADLNFVEKYRDILEGRLIDLLDGSPWSFSAFDSALVNHSEISTAELLQLTVVYFCKDFVVVVYVFLLYGDENLLAES